MSTVLSEFVAARQAQRRAFDVCLHRGTGDLTYLVRAYVDPRSGRTRFGDPVHIGVSRLSPRASSRIVFQVRVRPKPVDASEPPEGTPTP